MCGELQKHTILMTTDLSWSVWFSKASDEIHMFHGKCNETIKFRDGTPMDSMVQKRKDHKCYDVVQGGIVEGVKQLDT